MEGLCIPQGSIGWQAAELCRDRGTPGRLAALGLPGMAPAPTCSETGGCSLLGGLGGPPRQNLPFPCQCCLPDLARPSPRAGAALGISSLAHCPPLWGLTVCPSQARTNTSSQLDGWLLNLAPGSLPATQHSPCLYVGPSPCLLLQKHY